MALRFEAQRLFLDGQLIAIPKAGSVAHVKENALALDIGLSQEEIELIEKAFPAPGRKTPLDRV
jgi:diketogulonate reductase-like aldo/keto reductase